MDQFSYGPDRDSPDEYGLGGHGLGGLSRADYAPRNEHLLGDHGLADHDAAGHLFSDLVQDTHRRETVGPTTHRRETVEQGAHHQGSHDNQNPAGERDDALDEAHGRGRRLAEAGDLTGARSLLEEALAAGELRHGRDHPRLARLMVDLATIARNVGNLTEAQNQLRRAYGILSSSSGPENPTALSVEGRLATVTYRLGEPTEAYDWHLADVGRRVLGADHPAVKGAEQRLAARPIAMPVVDLTPEAVPGRIPDHDEPDEPEEDPGHPPTYAPHAPGVYQRRPDPTDVQVVTPPPRVYADIELLREPPLVASRVPSRRAHRGGITLVMSLGAAVLIAAAVIVATQFVLPGRDPIVAAPTFSEEPQPTPSESGPPAPTTVKLRDNGGSVTLTWSDPGDGRVPFIVTGGRIGEPTRPYETIPAGRTNWTVYGLNNTYNYCFTVAAVWSTTTIASSDRLCTNRLSTTPPR